LLSSQFPWFLDDFFSKETFLGNSLTRKFLVKGLTRNSKEKLNKEFLVKSCTGVVFGCTGVVFGSTGVVFGCTGVVFGCTGVV
jgi:D-serine dehydratase